MFPQTLLLLFLSATASIATVVKPKPKPPLKPYLLHTLTTFSPSGRPGSSPWSLVNLTFSDLEFNNNVTCGAKYTWEDPLWNNVTECAHTPTTKDKYTKYSFQMLKPTASGEGASLLNNFMLHLRHDAEKGVYVATQRFNFDSDRNIGGLCSASGVCSFGLREEVRPYYIHQTKLER
ncbi:hypothetical protein QBC35DRAFT_505468 [Podospora australis]|uniref:AA1-like domain-containing protein n=1 Tax=Podospora australis TaxID=1536484 RepID=A0AAN6WNQ3_9PEZI|nr:hypothetical protein QBC35DRAFT_505468 [Podospora australis]